LVIPFGLHWTEVRASDLIAVDLQTGKVVDKGSGRGMVEPSATAFYLHSRLHLAKGKAGSCLLHNHAPYATALTMVHGGRFEMVHQNSMRFQDQIAYDLEYNGLVLGPEEGDRLADIMQNKNILFMGNHGVLVAGASVSIAFNSLYYLERASMHQVLAMSTGLPLRKINDKVLEEAKKYYPGKEERLYADHLFNALKRILDREQPDYQY
jgi:ribulose-5-phosphate 4-epimerase/fuculose-1-phosphate aldolase